MEEHWLRDPYKFLRKGGMNMERQVFLGFARKILFGFAAGAGCILAAGSLPANDNRSQNRPAVISPAVVSHAPAVPVQTLEFSVQPDRSPSDRSPTVQLVDHRHHSHHGHHHHGHGSGYGFSFGYGSPYGYAYSYAPRHYGYSYYRPRYYGYSYYQPYDSGYYSYSPQYYYGGYSYAPRSYYYGPGVYYGGYGGYYGSWGYGSAYCH